MSLTNASNYALKYIHLAAFPLHVAVSCFVTLCHLIFLETSLGQSSLQEYGCVTSFFEKWEITSL